MKLKDILCALLWDWARHNKNGDAEKALLEVGALSQDELELALIEMFNGVIGGDIEMFREGFDKGVDPRIPAPTIEGDVDLVGRAAELGRG